ncbi:MAG: DUF4199 domain-containing protein [Rhodothermales bacterium]|nr:DUF4199 domain-containing protein [Rhodothermales bacterium]MBO6779420.1 DUF4199 domain-containing protein [Rhodothermales bacterium]
MQANVRWGLVLGASVFVVTLVFALLGWHKTFSMSFAFLAIAIGLNIVAVVQCLRAYGQNATWGGQVLNGLVVGAVASVLIFAGSLLVTTVIFPEYFAEMAEGYRTAYADMGLSEAEVEDLVAATENTSAVRSAFDGVVGTMVTSLLVAAIGGIWIRKKD